MMNEKDINKLKKQLEEERARLVKEVEAEEKPKDFGEDSDHYDEEADEAEEFGNKLAVAQTLKDRITEIDSILSAIASGDFEMCKHCKISLAEKNANESWAEFCKRCGAQHRPSKQ